MSDEEGKVLQIGYSFKRADSSYYNTTRGGSVLFDTLGGVKRHISYNGGKIEDYNIYKVSLTIMEEV